MRLCISLRKFDLIERLDDGRYRLGVEAARLGSVYSNPSLWRSGSCPSWSAFLPSAETASFYIRRGNQRLCLFRVDSPYPLRMNVRPGDMRPMDRGSISQVLFAFTAKTPPKRSEVRLPIYTSGITDPHVASLSMPVFGAEGRFLGALALSGPSSRLTAERANTLGSRLLQAADRLSSELGGDL